MSSGATACARDDAGILGGIALFHGRPVTVIGHRKGRTLEENLRLQLRHARPRGLPQGPAADAAGGEVPPSRHLPLSTPPALTPAWRPEERGQGEAIARNLLEMSRLNVPVIAVITGEGGSGGALALAVANRGADAGKRRVLHPLPGGLCLHPVEGRLPLRRGRRS